MKVIKARDQPTSAMFKSLILLLRATDFMCNVMGILSMNHTILLQVRHGRNDMVLQPPDDQCPQWRGNVSLCERKDNGMIAVLGGYKAILDVFNSQGM